MCQLAILVPYRNQKSYLDIFLSEVPKYPERVNALQTTRSMWPSSRAKICLTCFEGEWLQSGFRGLGRRRRRILSPLKLPGQRPQRMTPDP